MKKVEKIIGTETTILLNLCRERISNLYGFIIKYANTTAVQKTNVTSSSLLAARQIKDAKDRSPGMPCSGSHLRIQNGQLKELLQKSILQKMIKIGGQWGIWLKNIEDKLVNYFSRIDSLARQHEQLWERSQQHREQQLITYFNTSLISRLPRKN